MGALRRLSALVLAALAGLLVAAPVAFAGAFLPEAGGSPNADQIRNLHVLVASLGLLVFIGVEGLLFYCMWRFRARKGAIAAQIHGNTRLEVGWTVAAALILVFITAITFIQLPRIIDAPESDIDRNGNPVANAAFAATDTPDAPRGDSMTIRVDGQQYVWRYQYPGRERVFSYVDMVVPVGMTVILEITSDDVVHTWWIPKLGPKFDAIPGYVNKSWFKIPRPGRYYGQCAELCGRNHTNMVANVVALPFPEWQRWYDNKAREIEAAQQGAAEQRRQIERAQGEQATQGGGGAGGATDADQDRAG